MISGTSIAKIANLLLDMEIPPENIEVIVLAIDRKYNFMDFIDPKSGISLFSRERTSDFEDPECIRLSNDIAQMIAVAGESYNVDFPEYNRFTVDDKKFESFFNKSLWNIYEVTNVFHQKGGNVVYTFIPKPAVVDRVSQYLKCNIWKFSQLKIRLIAHKNNEHEYSCVIVPLVVIGKISFESLHKIWECILGEDLEQPIGRIHWNNTALFRLIQFFIPMVLANMFIKWNELSGIVSLDFTCIPMLFGYDCASFIDEFARKDKCPCASEKIVVIPKINEHFSKEFKRNFCKRGAFDINARLLKPFSHWYTHKEIPVRDQIVEYAHSHGGINFRSCLDILHKIDCDDRLNHGYSLEYLCNDIADMAEHYDIPSTVLIFLDRAIDMGLIVPTNSVEMKEGTICRCYRNGEDFPFSSADQSRLMYFLCKLNERLDGEVIGKINFEKIIVLFMQLAKKSKSPIIFNDFQGFDNHELLTVKYCIHGAVLVNVKQNAQIDQLHPYAENNSYCPWLKELLLNDGLISEVQIPGTSWPGIKINASQLANKILEPTLTQEVESQIGLYASVIGNWYMIYKTKHQAIEDDTDEKLGTGGFRRDITILTSCSSLDTLAGSLLAELHYCLLDLEETVFGKLVSGSYEAGTMKLCKDFDLYFGTEMNSRDERRKYKTNAYSAMYNGITKASDYHTGGAEKVIRRVSEYFTQSDSTDTLKNLWQIFWSKERAEKVPPNQELQKWVYECITYLYIFYISYSELHNLASAEKVSIEDSDSPYLISTQKFREQFNTEIFSFAQASNVDDKLIRQVNKLCKEESFRLKDLQEKKLSICGNLKSLEKNMTSLCQNIEMYLSEQSLQYIESYQFCTILTLSASDENNILHVLRNESKPGIRGIEWVQDGPTATATDTIQYCMLFLSEDLQDETLSLFAKFFNKIVVFKDLPEQLAIKYNVRTDGKNLQMQFQQNVLDALSKNDIMSDTYCIVSPQKIKSDDIHKYCKYFSCSASCVTYETTTALSCNLHLSKFVKSSTVNETVREEKTIMNFDVRGNNNQIQLGTVGSTQKQKNINVEDNFDYEQVLKVLKEIKQCESLFDETFGDKADNVNAILDDATQAAKEKNSSALKKALSLLKDLVVGASGSIIASGILSQLQSISL